MTVCQTHWVTPRTRRTRSPADETIAGMPKRDLSRDACLAALVLGVPGLALFVGAVLAYRSVADYGVGLAIILSTVGLGLLGFARRMLFPRN